MTLTSIDITMPKEIHRLRAARMIEDNLRKETKYKVICEHLYDNGTEEEQYRVWVNDTEAFYYLGLVVATIIEEHNKIQSSREKIPA